MHESIQENRLKPFEDFPRRHIGPSDDDVQKMLKEIGMGAIEELISRTVPESIRTLRPLRLPESIGEMQALTRLREMACENQVFRSYIGAGYSNCITPVVIQRNILENPGWYTQYTPYQAEIAQGRLEALLSFQTMIGDLTGLAVANASLLDEATAAAEAMSLCWAAKGKPSQPFFVSKHCHPQTIEVVRTRARPLGIPIQVGDEKNFDFSAVVFGALLQYPTTEGWIEDYRAWIERVHASGAMVVMAADLLALCLLKPPGELGADVAVGSAQRFGVPLGYGGPHAAYLATRDEHKRLIPGRIVGVSVDVDGRHAVRLALQTREQHIRRDKATSNICTAQVLLAIISSMYAVYHGPAGLKKIAERTHFLAAVLDLALRKLGYQTGERPFFDAIHVEVQNKGALLSLARSKKINLRDFDGKSFIGIALDETAGIQDLDDLIGLFAEAAGKKSNIDFASLASEAKSMLPAELARRSPYLTHPVFNSYHSETEMLRYLYRLQQKDLSLATSMIPLGSCTMKLNATSEMIPITWPEFSNIHPFVPLEQTRGYQKMFRELENQLAEVTGFSAMSLQPNAGSQGEYAGLLVIEKYHESRGDLARRICLIPKSAHGTNPASAVMAGFQVVVVECDENGNIDVTDLKKKCSEHAAHLAALMVTYPSTHGVFEEKIREICEAVHAHGGQVYMDGANFNAQIGLCKPGEFGPDVCHLNLHKTFCIPHGGGGPGMGPIAVKEHLAPFLPTHPWVQVGGKQGIGPVSAAPWGSAGILPISWMYISMMGAAGLKHATEIAILNANYIAKRLEGFYPVLYKGKGGYVAHECIFDLRPIKSTTGIDVEDIAKRLMDYGFHAPTVSFPVAGTLMVEPTESESKHELDRFCDAMILIREEIREIESGKMDRQNNPLKNAPHTAEQIARVEWSRPYSREKAVFPAPWTRLSKFWPSVGRINNVQGDRQLICTCPSFEDMGLA